MSRLILSIAAGLLIASGTITPAAQAEVVNIVLDTSKSTLLTTDEDFARRAGIYIFDRLKTLEFGDKVQVRMVGAHGGANRNRRIDLTVSRRDRAGDIAKAIAALVASIPSQIASGQLEAENDTNLIGYLEAESALLDCQEEPTEIIFASDGVESSEYVNDKDLLAHRAHLPLPESPFLENCNLTILGLGRLESNSSFTIDKLLTTEWTAWSEAAGIKTFTGVRKF